MPIPASSGVAGARLVPSRSGVAGEGGLECSLANCVLRRAAEWDTPRSGAQTALLPCVGQVEAWTRERMFGRFAKAGGERRQSGDERAPGPAIVRGHFLPALGIFQKQRAFVRRQAGEFPEGSEADTTLLRRQFLKCPQSILHFAPLRLRKGAECFFLFVG